MTDAEAAWPTAERQLCDKLLTAWFEHGSNSDEFLSLIRQAVHEFDVETVIFTLLAISTTLTEILGEILGPDNARALSAHFTATQEAPTT